NTILLVGYQAEGTRGRTLENGAQDLKFFGSYHPVRATIRKMDYLSGHADQRDIMDWLRQFKHPPKNVLINHGEPHASDALRAKIHHELGWNCEVAHMHQTYQII
ncbi:MAG TPA: MBL fold metallo-hydrolase RNA specificity domain-containing protein, partial [Saprospiraceae bacterium]|nr:MBL fold metallo-hydrolase RNA specificity domain-containing protein [Saprospiraceae bacterium]